MRLGIQIDKLLRYPFLHRIIQIQMYSGFFPYGKELVNMLLHLISAFICSGLVCTHFDAPFRQQAIDQIERRSGNYQSANYFLDMINELEAMGDFMINVSQSIVSDQA